jgi:RNA polymerase sigma factor (sigma-70 family)
MEANQNEQFRSDSELLDAIKKGSEEAKGQLYRKHYSALLKVTAGFLRRHGCNQPNDHAEGIQNGVWSNILPSVSGLRDVTRFEAWRDTIARNEANKHLKTCIREQNTSVELADKTVLPEARISNYYESRDAAIDAEKMLTLAKSISQEFALIFQLYTLKELEFDEIAIRLGKNLDTIRTTYYRGREKLMAKVRSRGG